jgi:hypothetical protein
LILKAKLLHQLNQGKKISLKKLSETMGLKPAYLCHILRLNRLPEIVIDGYYAKNISLSHLFIISRLSSEEQIITAYEQVLSHNLTVLQTEELIREQLHQIKTSGSYLTGNEKDNYIGKITNNHKRSRLRLFKPALKAS